MADFRGAKRRINMTHEITVKITGFEKRETAKLFFQHLMNSGILCSDREYAKKAFPEVNNGGINFSIK